MATLLHLGGRAFLADPERHVRGYLHAPCRCRKSLVSRGPCTMSRSHCADPPWSIGIRRKYSAFVLSGLSSLKSIFRRLAYLSLPRAWCRPVIHLNLSLRDHHESHSFVVRLNLETTHKSSICESEPRVHQQRYANNPFTSPLFKEQ